MRDFRFLSVLLVIVAVTASIKEPAGIDPDKIINLWGPFEFLRVYNRWICTIVCSAIIVYAWGRGISLTLGAKILLIIHLLVFAKNIVADTMQAIPLIVGYMSMIFAISFTAEIVVKRAKFMADIWKPVVYAALGFLVINLVQYLINPASTTVVGERFHGMTSNPQMFALAVAIMVPAFLCEYTSQHRKVPRPVLLGLIIMLFYFIYLSGSRLAILLSALSVMLYYRQRFIKLSVFVLPLLGIVFVWYKVYDFSSYLEGVRVLSVENTRGDAWLGLTKQFGENFFTGAPVDKGGRVEFGESSFLAAGVALGVVGFVLIWVFVMWVWNIIVRLIAQEKRLGWMPEIAMPIAILSTCLAASVFEAVLFGIFTFPMVLLVYSSVCAECCLKRLEVRKKPRKRILQQGGKDPINSSIRKHEER